MVLIEGVKHFTAEGTEAVMNFLLVERINVK
jgi:hypothetical protein